MTMINLLAEHASSVTPRWMQQWLDVNAMWEVWWLGIGVIAQAMFFSRWIIQWLASERRGKSHMPDLFWWCSLVGASMLLVYYIGRREPVGIIGQLTGWMIYSRNLHLIHKARRAAASSSATPAAVDD